MRSLKQVFMLWLVALAVGALRPPAVRAGEADPTGAFGSGSGFGGAFGSPFPVTSFFSNTKLGSTLAFDVKVQPFQCTMVSGCDNLGNLEHADNNIYTYVYTITQHKNMGSFTGNVAIDSISVGGPNSAFEIGLNYGFYQGESPASAFSFSTSSLSLKTGMGNPFVSSLPPMSNNMVTFYAQSTHGPIKVFITASDNSISTDGDTWGPSPEPSSIALFGSGLVLLGGAIRRRLRKKAT